MEKKLQAMFEEIGYEGVFEVEYLIDKDGTAYFLEINFRASCWNHTTNIADMAESFLWIKGMMNGSIDPADRKEFEPFTSMSEIIDYGKRVDSGKVTLAEWLRDFKEAKCTYYYHKDDMGPWEYVSDKWEQYK
jgi:predicted ATP-grasp superfamily ATP-dependent carboligase